MSRRDKSRKTNNRKKKSVKLRLFNFFGSLNYLGLIFAVIFFTFSVLPSLLPRPWLYQGVISGISISIGYGIGVLASKLIRFIFKKELSQKFKKRAWRFLYFLGPIIVIIYLYLGSIWQREVHQLVGEFFPENYYFTRILLLTFFVSILLLMVGRLIAGLNKFVINQLDKFLPRRVGVFFGSVIVIGFLWWIVSGVFYNFFVTQSNRIYSNQNNQTPANVNQPQQSSRSGSPESLVSWDSIGFQGKNFVSRGPSQQQLQDYTGNKPTEQIRVYVGLNSADSAQSRAKLALEELKRTKAFEREVLVLATATGTGWLEPQSVDSIEYMYGGDTAIVSQQYSYLPSWISFLVDKNNAKEAGRALYDEVHTEWSKLPEDKRPKLIAYGLSLGSFGGQSAYSSSSDLIKSIDGALFLGTPNDTELWRSITDNRERGTPEWLPIYQNGSAVRFAANNDGILKDQSQWQKPRVLYMQHASDPVVWFSFDLITNEPDWLREPRGYDVSPSMQWYPFVTFLQVGIDQFFGTTVPNGHGHNYPNTIVDAWSSVVSPSNWNDQKADKLQKIIDTYSNE